MELNDQEILAIANPLMDNLMEASTEIDYEKHVRDFTDRLKKHVPRDRFISMCEGYQRSIGILGHRELVGIFRRPDSAAVIWKQFLSKAEGEFVAEMVLVKQGERYLVDHALFF